MSEIIYGVDTSKPVTPELVKSAIINCFYQAHCKNMGAKIEDPKMGEKYCKSLVLKAFKESGGDFEKPTKKSITDAMQKLAEFSKNFRDPQIIRAHYDQIMKLVKLL